MSDSGSGLRLRPGGRGDVPALMELTYRAPSRSSYAVSGSVDASRAFRSSLLDRCLADSISKVILIEDASGAVGYAEMSTRGDVPPLAIVAACAIQATGYATAFVNMLRSVTLLGVALSAPKGGLHLVELQVAPNRRNHGLGARLLAAVEYEARSVGAAHVSLTTAIENPARHLYDRHGFIVVEEKRSRLYERMTGSPGRVLMVKHLEN